MILHPKTVGKCYGLVKGGFNLTMLKQVLEDYGVIPENTNFGIKTSVVRSILESSNVSLRSPNRSKISKSKLGKMISDATYYLSCWMTMAQIKKMRSKKVIFQNLD